MTPRHLASICLAIVAIAGAHGCAQGLEPHAPISITSDAILLLPDLLVGNGVRSGLGTVSNPFVISGWNISSASQDGILIANTASHIVVRANTIRDGLASTGRYLYSGIVVQNATNVTIVGNTIENQYTGVFLRENVGAEVRQNEIRVTRNAGIESADSRATIVDNVVERSDGTAILAAVRTGSTTALVVRDNVVRDSEEGVRVRGGDNAVVEQNRVERVAGVALRVESTDAATVRQNLASRSGIGLELAGARGLASQNTLFANDVGLVVEGASTIRENAIHDNDAGVLVSTPGAAFQQNDLFDNREVGLQADRGFDASENWWGAGDGPSGDGSGSGDRVVGATYEPFATEPFTQAGKNRGNAPSLGKGGPSGAPAEGSGDGFLALLLLAAVAIFLALLAVAKRR